MKRILFEVPKWHVIRQREHRERPLPSPCDLPLDQLEDEIAERLYAGELDRAETDASPAVQAWAESVHDALGQLPAFQRLAAECRGDAAAAAAAVGEIMDELRPYLEELRKPPAEMRERIRRPAGAACQAASKAVQELREALSGLSGVAFRVRAPGTAEMANRSVENAPARTLGAMLRRDSRLREIALLAGRMRRIAAGKRRERVRHAADEIADVEQGDSLARALPSELARLRHPRRRLDFLRSVLERQVLQYQLVGTETLGRGPLVLLLDKSGSMEGAKDAWATAFSLALLEHAAAERRPFAVVHFNGRVSFEAMVRPGEELPREALFVGCDGGTDIGRALKRGLDLADDPRLRRRADVVLVTDGESDPTSAEGLRELARGRNVTVLGLGIAVPKEALTPWCDEVRAIERLDTVEESLATTIFGDS
jgi:uncharacterized protein with von Willebrand factor type A (vWA) domain